MTIADGVFSIATIAVAAMLGWKLLDFDYRKCAALVVFHFFLNIAVAGNFMQWLYGAVYELVVVIALLLMYKYDNKLERIFRDASDSFR